MPAFDREVQRLEGAAYKDARKQGERLVPGVAYFQDNFPRVSEEISRFGRSFSARKNPRGATGRGFKSTRGRGSLSRGSRTAKAGISHVRSLRGYTQDQLMDLSAGFDVPPSVKRPKSQARSGRVEPKRLKFGGSSRDKRSRVDDFVPDDHEFVAPSQREFVRESQRANMPRRSQRSRGGLKSHSRNIRSNLTLGKPMRQLAFRSQYAEVKEHTKQSIPALDPDDVLVLSAVPQGTTSITRIGDELKAISLGLLYQVNLTATALASQSTAWRLTIFSWNMNSSISPSVGSLFPSVPTEGAFKFFDLNRHPTYKILYDVSGSLAGDPAVKSVGNTGTGIVRVNIKPKASIMSYDSGSTDGTNQIFAMFQCDNAANGAVADLSWRMTFIDA